MRYSKAEEIYISTRVSCKNHIRAFGYEVNPDGRAVGFSFVTTELAVCTRTLNAIEKLLNRDRANNKLNLKYGIVSEEEFEKREQMMNMVESTIINTRKAIA